MKKDTLRNYELPFVSGVCFHDGALFEESVKRAADTGCTHFYIEGSYEDGANNWSPDLVEQRVSMSRRYGVSAIFHGNYKLPVAHEIESVRRAAVEEVKKEIDIAAAFQAPLILHGSLLFTHRYGRSTRQSSLDSLCASAKELGEYGAERGVEIWLENLERYAKYHPFYTLFSGREDYEEVLAKVDHPNVKFVFDVGHENVGGGDPASIVERFSSRIAALDLNDNAGERDSHLGLGQGSVDFEGLIAVLVRNDWKGHLTFETRGANVDDGLFYISKVFAGLNRGEA